MVTSKINVHHTACSFVLMKIRYFPLYTKLNRNKDQPVAHFPRLFDCGYQVTKPNKIRVCLSEEGRAWERGGVAAEVSSCVHTFKSRKFPTDVGPGTQ